jgi:hypothetical protein
MVPGCAAERSTDQRSQDLRSRSGQWRSARKRLKGRTGSETRSERPWEECRFARTDKARRGRLDQPGLSVKRNSAGTSVTRRALEATFRGHPRPLPTVRLHPRQTLLRDRRLLRRPARRRQDRVRASALRPAPGRPRSTGHPATAAAASWPHSAGPPAGPTATAPARGNATSTQPRADQARADLPPRGRGPSSNNSSTRSSIPRQVEPPTPTWPDRARPTSREAGRPLRSTTGTRRGQWPTKPASIKPRAVQSPLLGARRI